MSHDPLDFSSTQRQLTPGCTVFNRHELTERMAMGKRGEVWKARDPKLADMQVVLKLTAGNAQAEQLKASIESISDLAHPNILRTYGFAGDEDLSGIIMEHVKGQTLTQALRAKEPPFFEVSEVRPWAQQLFTALQFAWENGRVTHGDLRPANLFITTGGSLKIAEFCYAPLRKDQSLTDDDLTSGTFSLPCLSPQVVDGEVPTRADDLYAAGACLYEALTGKPVFFTGNIVSQIQQKVPPSIAERRAEQGFKGAAVPKEWESLIARCLAKERSDRPASAAEVVKLIESFDQQQETRSATSRKLTGGIVTAITGSAERRSLLLHPLMIIAASIVLLALAVQQLVLKPNQDALAELRAERESLDQADATAKTEQAPERLTLWEKFMKDHALKPISFTDEDEAIITHASSRIEHYQAEVARLDDAKADADRRIENLTIRLGKTFAAQKQADADTKFTTADRLAAWSTVQKEFAGAGHPETKAYNDLLAQISGMEKQWQQKAADEMKTAEDKQKAEAEAMKLAEQKASHWQQDRSSAWAAVQTQCVDPLVSAFVKAQELAAFLPTLAEPPKGAEKRAEELRALAVAEQKKALDASAAETPKSPLKLADLLVDSPVKDQPEKIKKAYVMLIQQKLKDSGHYKSKPDGDHGPGSHTALVEYQKNKQLVASAKLDVPTVKALGMDSVDLEGLKTIAAGMREREQPDKDRGREPPASIYEGFKGKLLLAKDRIAGTINQAEYRKHLAYDKYWETH